MSRFSQDYQEQHMDGYPEDEEMEETENEETEQDEIEN